MHPWQETSFPKRFLAQRQDAAQIKRDKCMDAPIKGAEGSKYIISSVSGKGCLPSHPPILPSHAQGLYLSKEHQLFMLEELLDPLQCVTPCPFSPPPPTAKSFLPPLSFHFVS